MMSDEILVSIIINNYNYGRFLGEAIDSALGQTYPHLEVIVVDDGSTDNSRDVISSYAGQVTALLKCNGGQASAFNAGFAASRGEVVCFLDSDDVLLPSAIEAAAELFTDSDVVKVHWPLWEIDQFGRKTGRLCPNQALAAGNLREHVISHGPNSYVNAPTSGNAWARFFLEEVFPVSECGDKHGADAYLFALAPLFGPIKRVDQPKAYYRVHSSNFSGNLALLDKMSNELRRYEHHCLIMSEQLRKMGVAINQDTWKGPNTAYGWMMNLSLGREEIMSIIPPGALFILVDECQWGPGPVVADRSSTPFLEHDGQYWGPPPDDQVAIKEVERLRSVGASFIVFAWPAFWWLDHYRLLLSYLRSCFSCVLDNERLVVFDLSV